MSESSSDGRPGTVCTFYSYKGGVGRSMAVANVGVVMATEGHRVLLIDWDLEAPGLEVYFSKATELKGDPRTTPGVLDLLEAQAAGETLAWEDCRLEAQFFGRSLDIISAGSRTGDYRRRVQQLNWDELFRAHRIGNYINRLREAWRTSYDVVLIDSRTGITDIGDICTVLLPDVLVLMFTPSLQSVEGIKDAMARAVNARSKLPVNRSKLLGVPLPARDERDREYDKSVEWQAIFASTFGDLYREWLPKEIAPVDALNKLYIPYVAAWSFGERLPVIESDRERSDPSSLGAAYGRLATLLVHRLDWYAIEGRASVNELVGARIELSKARDDKHAAEALVVATKQRARAWSAGIAAALLLAALGAAVWYQNRPDPVSTELFVGDRLQRENDLAGSLLVFEARRKLLQDNSAAAPLDTDIQRELSLVFNRIGGVLEAQGKLADALTSYQAGKATVDKLVAKDPDNAEWQRELAVAHNWIGGALQAQGKLAEALTSFQAAKATLDKLVAKDPDNADWQRLFAVAHNWIGDVLQAQGKLAEALTSFQGGKATVDKHVAKDPDNAAWQRELAVAHNRIGAVLEAQGKLAEALTSYQAEKATVDKLVAKDPDNADWQRELAVAHNRIGGVLQAQGKLAEALTLFQAGKVLVDKLLTKDRRNADLQQLAIAHNRIGGVLEAQGNLAEALSSFQADKAIMDNLVANHPDNTNWQREVALSNSWIGRILEAQERLPEALASFDSVVSLSAKLVAVDSTNAVWQRDLSAAHKFRGKLKLSRKQPDEALKDLDRAIEISNRRDLAELKVAQRDEIEIQGYRVEAFLALSNVASARDACNYGRTEAGRLPVDSGNSLYWALSLTRLEMACAAVAAREGNEAGALKSIVATVDHLHSLSATYPEVNELRHEIAQAEQRAVVLRSRR